jgi:hypothetical protein
MSEAEYNKFLNEKQLVKDKKEIEQKNKQKEISQKNKENFKKLSDRKSVV